MANLNKMVSVLSLLIHGPSSKLKVAEEGTKNERKKERKKRQLHNTRRSYFMASFSINGCCSKPQLFRVIEEAWLVFRKTKMGHFR